MKIKKSFGAPPPIQVSTIAPLATDANSFLIELPDNPSNCRTLDLTDWLGKGVDAWVWACAGQLRAFRDGKAITTSTVVAYCQQRL